LSHLVGVASPPGWVHMFPLWEPKAAAVPPPRPFPRIPMSGLRGLLHPADGHDLRENSPTTSHARAAAGDRPGGADRTPGTRVGPLMQTAPYLAATHPDAPDRQLPARGDDRHHLRGG
jgi:hypothetical protein